MSLRKTEREQLIRKLIQEQEVTDQRMLLDLLIKRGVKATQATVSRDLRLMGIQKRRSSVTGRSKYVLPSPNNHSSARSGGVHSSMHHTYEPRVVVPSSQFIRTNNTDVSNNNNVAPSTNAIKEIVISGPFVVVKTADGMARSIARSIDELQDPSIVATIAGNDTILIVPSEMTTRERLNRALGRLFPIVS